MPPDTPATPDPKTPSTSLTERSLGAGLWTLSGAFTKTLLRLFVLVVLARLLSPSEFGLMASAMVVIEFFRIFVLVGVGPVVVQRPTLEERHKRTASLLSVGMGVSFGVMMVFLAPFVAHTVFRTPALETILTVACIALPLYGLSVLPQALMQRELRLKTIVQIETIAYLVGYIAVGMTLALAGFGVWSLVFATLSEALLVAVFSLIARPCPVGWRTDRETLREMTFFGGGFAAARVANYFALAGDRWIIGRMLGDASLGIYKYAYELATLPGVLLGQVLDRVMFPAMAIVQSEPERLARAYRRGLTLVSTLVLPLSAAMVLLADELILFVLGPKWVGVIGPFRILAVAAVLRSSLKIADSLARAKGALYQRTWRQALYGLAVIIGCWLGSRKGLPWAAAGVVIGVTCGYALMTSLGVRISALRWRDVITIHLRSIPLTTLAAAGVLGGSSVAQTMHLPDYGVIAIAMLSAAVIVIGTVLAAPSPVLGPDARDALRTLARPALARAPRLRESQILARILGAEPAAAQDSAPSRVAAGRELAPHCSPASASRTQRDSVSRT